MVNGEFMFIAASIVLLLITVILWIRTSRALRLKKREIVELRQQNTSKDQSFAVISHDLRSAVYTLKINLSRIRKAIDADASAEIIELTESTELLTGSTLSLLNNLLYWSMTETGQISFQPEPIHIKPLLEQVSYDFTPIAAAKNIRLEVDVFHELSMVGDLNSVKIILRNLIDNAIKFTPENGEILISAMPLDDQCLISVRDTGEGIGQQTLESLNAAIFNISRKDTSGKRSTGLGLWLATTMAAKNQGRLSISSSPSQGTSITLVIPLHPLVSGDGHSPVNG